MLQPRFGTESFTISEKNGHILLHTEFEGGQVADLGACNDGTWHKVPLPFASEDSTYYGSSVRRASVTGGDPMEASACVLCRDPEELEVHLRSKGFMGGKIFRFSRKKLVFLPYSDFARENRSGGVKHENLDRLAVSGEIVIDLVKQA